MGERKGKKYIDMQSQQTRASYTDKWEVLVATDYRSVAEQYWTKTCQLQIHTHNILVQFSAHGKADKIFNK